MVITLDKFGGTIPQIIDPALLPSENSIEAVNVRFDRGGVTALQTDSFLANQAKDGELMTIYLYEENDDIFTWFYDVDVCESPNPSDILGRIYYTEEGEFKVTDNVIYRNGGNEYPMQYWNPSPPAPLIPPSCSGPSPSTAVTSLVIDVSAVTETDGSHNLTFSGGGGDGAEGTYDVNSNQIIAVNLVSGGSGYSSNPVVSTESGGGSILARGVADQTFLETRGYVYTLVNGYGAEGPPSPVSNLIDLDSVEFVQFSVSIFFFDFRQNFRRIRNSAVDLS